MRRDADALAGAIRRDCGAFLFTPLAGAGAGRSGFEHGKHQLDAMWAELVTGVPTVNGYSGNAPPDWGFKELTLHDDDDERRTEHALADWCGRHGVDPKQVCRIRGEVDWSWSEPTEPLLSAVWRIWTW